MTTKKTIGRGAVLVLVMALAAGILQASESLNRSIYMPIEFQLCEHLTGAVFYQDDAPVSTMPASRVFQFTYYPKLEQLLPERVRVRIEGHYVEDEKEFVAKLVVSPSGVHSAHRTREADTVSQVEKQKHKIDIRLEEKTIRLQCPRFCKRASESGRLDRTQHGLDGEPERE